MAVRGRAGIPSLMEVDLGERGGARPRIWGQRARSQDRVMQVTLGRSGTKESLSVPPAPTEVPKPPAEAREHPG